MKLQLPSKLEFELFTEDNVQAYYREELGRAFSLQTAIYDLGTIGVLTNKEVEHFLKTALTVGQIHAYLPFYRKGIAFETFSNHYPEYFI